MTTKYGKKAQSSVKSAMHEFKHGKLKSGKAGTKVENKRSPSAYRRPGRKARRFQARASSRL